MPLMSLAFTTLNYYIDEHIITEETKGKFSSHKCILAQTLKLLEKYNITKVQQHHSEYTFDCDIPHKEWLKLCVDQFALALSKFKNIPPTCSDMRGCLNASIKKYLIDKDLTVKEDENV